MVRAPEIIMRRLPTILILLVCLTAGVFAQAVYTPKVDSAERKAILGALRVPVEKDFKQKIVFVVDTLNSNGTWAYIGGTPQKPGGGNPDLTGTKFAEYEDAYDHNYFGLLKKTGGKWRVVTYAIGCTDVCFADWWSRYKAPKAIFPYAE
jgi:hypothetical protein